MKTAPNPETSFPASGASRQPLTLHLWVVPIGWFRWLKSFWMRPCLRNSN